MGIKYEWHVLLDEDEWERAEARLDPIIPPHHTKKRRLFPLFWASILLFAGLAVSLTGYGLWQKAQNGLREIQADLSATVRLENTQRSQGDAVLLDSQASEEWQKQMQASAASTREIITATIVQMDLMDDQALVRLQSVAEDKPHPYTETRFYRFATSGWWRTEPDIRFWGDQRSFQSQHFVFAFHQRDQKAVAEAAALLDKRYPAMRRMLGLAIPANGLNSDAKISIIVEPTSTAEPHWKLDHTALVVPSPLLQSIPDYTNEPELLAEEVMDLLRYEAVTERLGVDYEDDIVLALFMLSGTRLWVAWEDESLLSPYRTEMVQWLYGNLPSGPAYAPVQIGEICQTLEMWQCSPYYGGISLPCSDTSPQMMPAVVPPVIRLDQILPNIRVSSRQPILLKHFVSDAVQGQSVAVATLLEYVAQDFGRQEIPAFLAGIGEGATWEQIAENQFGIQERDFTAGWQGYLLDEYGVDLTVCGE